MPGRRCAVFGCNNRSMSTKLTNSEIIYHNFPKTNNLVSDTVRKEWIRRCKRADKWNPNTSSICSVHFTANDYERDLRNELLGLPRRKQLKQSAVPSLNLPQISKNVDKVTLRGDTYSKRKMGKERKEEINTLLAENESTVSATDQPIASVTLGSSSDRSQKVICSGKIIGKMKYENDTEVLQTIGHVEYCSLNDLKQGIDIKEELEIGDTMILDGNKIINTEDHCNIKEEVSLLEMSDNRYKKYEVNEGTDQFSTEEFRDLDDGKCFNHVNQSVDIKDELEITDTLILDQSESVTNTDIACNIKREFSPVEKCDEEYRQDIKEDNDSFNSNADENKDGISDGAAPTYAKLKKTQPYICEHCNYLSATASYLKLHIDSVHHKLKKYKCEYCDYSTSQSANLRRHNKSIHQKIKDFKCEYCDYSASLNISLQYHIKSVHQKIKDFKCDYCEYSTSRESHLKYHIKSVHEKIKDFKCDYCDYSASRDTHLKYHIKSIHKKIKDFKCEYCDYSTCDVSNLKLHTKSVHQKIKDFKCDYCDYAAVEASQLKKHIKCVHQKIKDFKCEHCEYSAAHASHLRFHIKCVHQKIKDFECEYCDHSTSRDSNLKRHIKSVHQKVKDFKGKKCD